MWVIGIVLLIMLYTYIILFLGWHIPNHLTDKGKPPYYMVVLSILYAVISLMALFDLIKRYNQLSYIYLLFEIGSLIMGMTYIYAIRKRYEGGNVSYFTRIVYSLGIGMFIFGMLYAISSNMMISLFNGLLSTALCLLPIPTWLDKHLTPPSKESTAWYAVLHKFKYPRKED